MYCMGIGVAILVIWILLSVHTQSLCDELHVLEAVQSILGQLRQESVCEFHADCKGQSECKNLRICRRWCQCSGRKSEWRTDNDAVIRQNVLFLLYRMLYYLCDPLFGVKVSEIAWISAKDDINRQHLSDLKTCDGVLN